MPEAIIPITFRGREGADGRGRGGGGQREAEEGSGEDVDVCGDGGKGLWVCVSSQQENIPFSSTPQPHEPKYWFCVSAWSEWVAVATICVAPGPDPGPGPPGPRQSASQQASVAVFGSFCLALPFLLSSSMTDASLAAARFALDSRLTQLKALFKKCSENDGEMQRALKERICQTMVREW